MNAHLLVLFLSLASPATAPAAPQEGEMDFLKRDLQGNEMWFVETLDKLRQENNRHRIEEHVTQFRTQAEGAFVAIERLYLENAGDLESTWLSRLDFLGKCLDDLQKTKRWGKRIDFVVALKDPKDRQARQTGLNDLGTAETIRAQFVKGNIDPLKIHQANEALERARVNFERINDVENLAFTHLLLAINASLEQKDVEEHDHIVIAKDMWLKSSMSIDNDHYKWMLEQLRDLQKRGVGAPPEPEPAPAPAPAEGADAGKEKPKEPGADDWQKAPLKVKEDPKVTKLKTLAYAGEEPHTWQDFEIKGEASKTDVSRVIPEPFKPFGRTVEMIRNGDLYKIDLYGDKKAAEKLQLGPGKVATITMRQNQKDLGSPPYYFQVALGDNENMYGQSVSNAPSKDRAIVRYRTACKLEGQFQGKKWTLIDDNDSGQFGDVVQRSDDYASDQRFPMPDALFVGGLEHAIPFSEYMIDGDHVYQLRINEETYALESQTAATGRGLIALDWAGPVKPECLIVVGLDDRRNCAYDLMAQPKTPVVSGRYRLAYGVISVGKGEKAQRCLILPGKSEAVDVQDGLEKPIHLGAPFTVDFSIRSDKDEVMVVGTSVRVLGRGKEIYTRFSEVLAPQVTARTKETQKLLEKGKAMSKPDSEDIKNNPIAVAFPKSFRVKKEGKEIIQFQLLLRGHPLIGSAESAWR